MDDRQGRRGALRGRQPAKHDYSGFCRLVQSLRSRLPASERSLDKVAARAGLKRGQLYCFETVKTRSRLVERRTAEALATLYGATEDERRQLLEAAGHDYVPPTLIEEAESPLKALLYNGSFDESVKREFVKDIRLFIADWQLLRRKREARPRRAVIAAAGWQAQVFREDRFQRSLFPAVNEALIAGMEEVLIIVPPTMPKLRVLEQTFRQKGIRITTRFQERALGLGNVLLVAKPYLAQEPFALILPDDVDDEMVCLQRMVERYDKVHKPIIAVEPLAQEYPLALTRNFGIAVLAEEPLLSPEDQIFDLKGELQEKPTNPLADQRAHRIVGRYLLTPELFSALTDHNLTTAINRVWMKSSGVCAYALKNPLRSIAPLKHIITDMDAKEIFNPDYYR